MLSDKHTSKIVGQRIKQLRKNKQLTIEQVGRMVGVSEQQQSRYERGINRIDVEKLFLFSQLFEVDITSFFTKDKLPFTIQHSERKYYFDSECII
nr:helix-turn-helix transcriptional regulator [uncultured Moellerella sp.]